MKHLVITIGCEYGAGGPEIGKMLSNALGFAYYDRDLVDSVVDRIGVDKELVQKADLETNVHYSFDTSLGPRYANLTNRVISSQFQVIHDMAEKSSCVIIGRSGNYILKDRDDVLNIFIYAPEEIRIHSIMEHKKISERKAAEIVHFNDEKNHARHKYITGTYRGDRSTRHIMIDSSLLGWEKTAQYLLMLVEMIEEKVG